MLCRVKEAVPAFDLVIIDCFHQLITPYLSDSKVGDRSVSAGGRGLSVGSGTGGYHTHSHPLTLSYSLAHPSTPSHTLAHPLTYSHILSHPPTSLSHPFPNPASTGNPPPIFSAPLILQFNTLLRSLCSDGRTTVVVTNTLQTR